MRCGQDLKNIEKVTALLNFKIQKLVYMQIVDFTTWVQYRMIILFIYFLTN